MGLGRWAAGCQGGGVAASGAGHSTAAVLATDQASKPSQRLAERGVRVLAGACPAVLAASQTHRPCRSRRRGGQCCRCPAQSGSAIQVGLTPACANLCSHVQPHAAANERGTPRRGLQSRPGPRVHLILACRNNQESLVRTTTSWVGCQLRALVGVQSGDLAGGHVGGPTGLKSAPPIPDCVTDMIARSSPCKTGNLVGNLGGATGDWRRGRSHLLAAPQPKAVAASEHSKS